MVAMADHMRILTVANYVDAAGGLERTQLTNCRGLAGRGHALDLVYVHDGAFTEQWSEFASTMTRVSTTLPRRASPFRSTAVVTSAVRGARHLKPEIVYVYRYWDLPFAVAVATASRASVVYHLCLPPPERVPSWFRSVLTRVDRTISVSRHTLDLWRDSGLRTDDAVIARTSVDLDAFRPAGLGQRATSRRALGIGENDFVIFFAGRLSPDKGIEVLLTAFRELVDHSDGCCRLVIVGSPSVPDDADNARRYSELLHRLGDGLAVTWLPRRLDVVPLLHAADVAVVPSVWPEPLARSILEALACGIPVVASSVGGSPELFTGWLSEFLVPPGDAHALADRLASIRDRRKRGEEIGKRCRSFAEEHLAPDDEFDVIEATMLGTMAEKADRR